MRILKVRFIKEYAGHKVGTVGNVLEPKYFELKKEGIVNLVAETEWKIPDDSWNEEE
jgi:hypothetical protein